MRLGLAYARAGQAPALHGSRELQGDEGEKRNGAGVSQRRFGGAMMRDLEADGVSRLPNWVGLAARG
jgi:hypothetical protein